MFQNNIWKVLFGKKKIVFKVEREILLHVSLSLLADHKYTAMQSEGKKSR